MKSFFSLIAFQQTGLPSTNPSTSTSVGRRAWTELSILKDQHWVSPSSASLLFPLPPSHLEQQLDCMEQMQLFISSPATLFTSPCQPPVPTGTGGDRFLGDSCCWWCEKADGCFLEKEHSGLWWGWGRDWTVHFQILQLPRLDDLSLRHKLY